MTDSSQPNNVVPIRKTEFFPIYQAQISAGGEVIEGEQLGLAFLQPSGRMFRLKLWMFPLGKYFLIGNDDRSTYKVLSPSRSEKSNKKSYWNEVGQGELHGPYIKIRLYMPVQEILVSLYPPAAESVKTDAA